MNNEKYKKSLKNVTKTIEFFTYVFYIWKRVYFALKHSLGKCSLYYYFPSNVFFSVA